MRIPTLASPRFSRLFSQAAYGTLSSTYYFACVHSYYNQSPLLNKAYKEGLCHLYVLGTAYVGISSSLYLSVK